MSTTPIHKIDNRDNSDDIEKEINELHISEMSPEDLYNSLLEFEKIHYIGENYAFSVEDSLREYGFAKQEDIDTDKIKCISVEIMDKYLTPLTNRIFQIKDAFDWCPPGKYVSLGSHANRAISITQTRGEILLSMANIDKLNKSPAFDIVFSEDNITGPTTYNPGNPTTPNNDYQIVIIYVLTSLKKLRYKRYKEYVCRQIKNTRAWEKIDKIEHYVEKLFRKERDYEMWIKFTKNGQMRKNLIEHLSCCYDSQFPELKKNRHVFSFSNGLYVCRHKDNNEPRFFPYESPEFKNLDPTIVSSNYFDLPFDKNEYKHWYDIPTPHLDRILNYQDFPVDVKKCIMYFIGRMLYDVNEMEKWQVILFMKGMASTGKGMICQLATYFYESEDVGTLSDTPEKQFGLSAISDKFCFIAPEITSKFGLGQADFQSLVSGENVSIGRKYKTAESVKWKVPGMFAGNEPPGYHDNSGSVQRRLVTVPFPNQVKPEDVDTELPDRLKAEVPAILRKCNEAYLEAVGKFVKGGIWAHLPQLIKTTREEMALSTNSLRHFMASPSIEYGPDKEIPLTIFIQHFNEHCKANNLGKYKFGPDFYNGPFSTKAIKVVQKSMIYHKNQKHYQRHQIIVGMDVMDDDDGISNDY